MMDSSQAKFSRTPDWYKDSIVYEVNVRGFFDRNNDGVGDLRGLTQKLDYLQNLGVTTLWLLPFFSSPLRDDGYDVSDYTQVHPDYGTRADFRRLLREAHARGLHIVIELAINHTSLEHPWFKRARKAAEGSRERDVYVWSDTPDRYSDARVLFPDFESSNWTWDSQARAYYWHRFYWHQPDLNFESEFVRAEMLKIIDYWFDLGVDGLRLDGVPYLFERDGTTCENLPETHEYLRTVRKHVDNKYGDRLLVAVANQWPEDAAEYYGDGDECQMAIHYPLMPRLFMTLQMEDSFPLVDIVRSTPDVPDSCQWAIFLRNHDELTLEMVTDEERDYMNRSFAGDPRMRINLGIRRRLAPLLGNDRRKIELMNFLLFSLPGAPVIYYGDEIGMGDNFFLGDRNGVRTPMQWNANKNAGFSDANPQQLYSPVIIDPSYHYESVNVENQERNPASLLWWMHRLIGMRRRLPALSRGEMSFVETGTSKVLAFTRSLGEETILVVANLSRYMQVAHLELPDHTDMVPEEVFGRTPLPAIGKGSYPVSLGAHECFWFALQPRRTVAGVTGAEEKTLQIEGEWHAILKGANVRRLEKQVLAEYLRSCRWFGAKSRAVRQVSIQETAPLGDARLLVVEISYGEGNPERYLLPVSWVTSEKAVGLRARFPTAVICGLSVGGLPGALVDAAYLDSFRHDFLEAIAARKRIRGKDGQVAGVPGHRLRGVLKSSLELQSKTMRVEQSNTSLRYGNQLFAKLYRKLADGTNPELEVVRFLTEKSSFGNIPKYAGALEYAGSSGEPVTLALVQSFVESQGDAWTYTTDVVARFFDTVLARQPIAPSDHLELREIGLDDVDTGFRQNVDSSFPAMARLLGVRTAQMHLALGSSESTPGFQPEDFSMLYQRSLYQSMQTLVGRAFQLLRQKARGEAVGDTDLAAAALEAEGAVRQIMRRITNRKIDAQKIRIHGDYHLGQVLYTGKDFVIMDFEGEPGRALAERKLRYPAYRDIAGMLRSIHYAGYATMFLNPTYREEDYPLLERWIAVWYRNIAGLFLGAYYETMGDSSIVPEDPAQRRLLLDASIVEKAAYELTYELNNRPGWAVIPLKGILSIVETEIGIER